MTHLVDPVRRRAAGAAALFLVAGVALGITLDRLVLSPPDATASPLTAEAMARELGLSDADEARLLVVLDGLHRELLAYAELGPDSFAVAARNAQHRISAALPPDARAGFHAWIGEHHGQLMRRLRDHPGSGMSHARDSAPAASAHHDTGR